MADSVSRTAASARPRSAAFLPSSSSARLVISESSGGSGRAARGSSVAEMSRLSLGPPVEWEGNGDGLLEVGSGHPSPLARARGCDVYIGFSGGDGAVLARLVSWLRAELELQGVSCFVSNRRHCEAAAALAAASTAMDAATVGVVVVSAWSLSNPYCVEEVRVFLERRKLVPIFVGLLRRDCVTRDIVHMRGELWRRFGGELWNAYDGDEREWRAVVDGLSRAEPVLEVSVSNLRDPVLHAIHLIGLRLGRRSMTEAVKSWRVSSESELPYPRNGSFVGRSKELFDLESLLLGDEMAQAKPADSAGTPERPLDHKLLEKARGKRPMEEVNAETSRSSYVEGVGCVCGESGIGKTELLLEFAHRHEHKYKKVLWVCGEGRYLRASYLKLADQLGLCIGSDLACDGGRGRAMSFHDIEGDAIAKIQKEFMRDIPFLVVIDNLESEKDWWDGRSVLDLLPRPGASTHVVISTRLSQVTNVKSFRLPALVSPEAMSLMAGSRDFNADETNALRAIEQRLGGSPLGLALVGAILGELTVTPLQLLNAMEDASSRELTRARKDRMLSRVPGLVQLLGACFALLDRERGLAAPAVRMVEAGSWFAPSPIPVSMLAHAACGCSEERQYGQFWKRMLRALSCTNVEAAPTASHAEAEALSTLLRLGIARSGTRTGYVCFHDIFKLYARMVGDGKVARAVVQAISSEGSVQQHTDQVWAACLLIFNFQASTGAVELPAQELSAFVRRFVLPLASHSFTTYSACSSVLDLLWVATDAIHKMEDRYVSEHGGRPAVDLDPFVYQDLARARTALLKARTTMMLKGGELGIAEQLCRTAVGISEVVYSEEHPETAAVRELLDRVVLLQPKF